VKHDAPETVNDQPAYLSKKNLAFYALVAFGLLLIYVFHVFVTSFLGAVMFYVLFKGFMETLTTRYRWKRPVAAALIIILSFFIVLIPVFGASYMLYNKIMMMLNDPQSALGNLHALVEKLNSLTGTEILSEGNVAEIKTRVGSLIPTFLGQFAFTLGNIALMYFMLYYMLTESERMLYEVNRLLPFDNPQHTRILADELDSQTKSNAIAVPLVAAIQGAAAGIGYWLFEVPDPIFWAVVTAFLSILPLFGTTIVWVPASIMLVAAGNTWPGLALFAYGSLVVINIDNLARLMIQKKFADVHPVITVFGVLVGLDLFGLPGLIFGPLMLSYFVILVRMYRTVYHKPMEDSSANAS
jgi:predicted PurR-regulated permease PerM